MYTLCENRNSKSTGARARTAEKTATNIFRVRFGGPPQYVLDSRLLRYFYIIVLHAYGICMCVCEVFIIIIIIPTLRRYYRRIT